MANIIHFHFNVPNTPTTLFLFLGDLTIAYYRKRLLAVTCGGQKFNFQTNHINL